MFFGIVLFTCVSTIQYLAVAKEFNARLPHYVSKSETRSGISSRVVVSGAFLILIV